MRFATIAVLAASALGASAQTVHTILVGAGGNLTYSPSNITADIGDFVSFVFQSRNHTVSQSTFADPCTQFTNTSIADPSKQNLTSGFMPVAANATSFNVWTIQVTQSTPIWFYCQQTVPASHCNKGMVGAINANASAANSFAAFQQKAMSLGTGSVTTSILPSGSGSTATVSSTASATGKPSGAMRVTAGVSSGAVATVGMGLVGVVMGLML